MQDTRLLVTSRLALAMTGAFCLVLQAQQPYWEQKSPAVHPPARSAHGMAYDAARGQVILFGGYQGPGEYDNWGDTWIWDGTNWTPRTPVNSPGSRRFFALAYDATRRETVLYGGGQGGWQAYDDTWVWDGSNWSLRTPANRPPARYMPSMAYDEVRGQVVLFGGVGPQSWGGFSDTWLWDGVNWTQVQPANRPPTRWQHVMTYDADRTKIILFGGWGVSQWMNDSWEWDGANWAYIPVSPAPPPRAGPAFAYDQARRKTVAFGGYGGAVLSDTWFFDGSNWTQQFPNVSPELRDNNAMAWDAARGQMVLFGGADESGGVLRHLYDDTWTSGVTTRTWYLHGSGGTSNPPVLFLNSSAPAGATARYKDSPGVRFADGNAWREVGTWAAQPPDAQGVVEGPARLAGWVGLKNSDDQGTRFDLRVEAYWNLSPIGSGELYCIDGVTRNPDLAKAVTVSLPAVLPSVFNGVTDTLTVKVLTRIGTTAGGTFCGGHSNATGLRLYFDATLRPASFTVTR